MLSGDDVVQECVVKGAIMRIHDAGVCNAHNRCNRGYDDVVTPASHIFLGVNRCDKIRTCDLVTPAPHIFLGGTGYDTEDIPGHEGGGEK